MAPIHDTDLAEQRWTQAEWEHYELWEKIEQRLRRRRRLWILATAAAFVMVSAIPVVQDQWPRWSSLAAARRLAQEINAIKRQANLDKTAYRLRFLFGEGPGQGARYRVERLARCSDPQGALVREGALAGLGGAGGLVALAPGQGLELRLPGLVSEFCYDAYVGSAAGKQVVGMAVAPDKDLAAGRTDRISVLLINELSAELSFSYIEPGA